MVMQLLLPACAKCKSILCDLLHELLTIAQGKDHKGVSDACTMSLQQRTLIVDCSGLSHY